MTKKQIKQQRKTMLSSMRLALTDRAHIQRRLNAAERYRIRYSRISETEIVPKEIKEERMHKLKAMCKYELLAIKDTDLYDFKHTYLP